MVLTVRAAPRGEIGDAGVVSGAAVLGVDVGGTAIKVVLSSAAGTEVLASSETPRDDPSGEATIETIAAIVAAAGPVGAVGVAVPGVVDERAGVCRLSVNLGWDDLPVRDLVADRLGLPAVLLHDVRAGARAERASGAGAGRAGGLLFAPLGTGLAVALLDERGEAVASPWAGEVGQVRHVDGPFAGLRVEEIASAGGLARRFGVPHARDVLDAVEAGDERAARAWQETASALAEVLAWGCAFAAPATVVVGGGLAQSGDALLEPLRASLAERLAGFPVPIVLPAVHGVLAAAVGAAQAARRLL